MDTKISGLTAGGGLQSGDLVPIVRGGANYNASLGAIGGPDPVAGQWMSAHDYAGAGGSTALVNTNMYLVPVLIGKKKQLDRLGVFLQTGMASQVFAMAVYANDPTKNRATGNPLGVTAFNLDAVTGSQQKEGALAAQPFVSDIAWYVIQMSLASNTATFTSPPASWAGVAKLVGDSSLANVISGVSSILQAFTVVNTFGSFPDLTSATQTPSSSNRSVCFFHKFL